MTNVSGKQSGATAAELAAARGAYAGEDINVDDDARASRCDDGSVWVQAWVLVSAEAIRASAARMDTSNASVADEPCSVRAAGAAQPTA